MKVSDDHGGEISGKAAGKTRLAPQARELLQDRAGNLPVWIRPPKTGTDYFCGLSRAKLYELASTGKIRSVSIRDGGAVKGTRLFHLASILAYIEYCEAGANTASTPAAATEAAP